MLIIVCRLIVIIRVIFLNLLKRGIMDKDILKVFGAKVREIRLSRDLSQEDLAHLANLHRTYIGMIERGEKNITLLNIEKISKALQLNIKELFLI